MIKLTNIHRNNDVLLCDGFVEDCSIPIPISFNEKTSELSEYNLPKDYEYCKSHIMHAKNYLKSLSGKDISDNEKIIMWY